MTFHGPSLVEEQTRIRKQGIIRAYQGRDCHLCRCLPIILIPSSPDGLVLQEVSRTGPR